MKKISEAIIQAENKKAVEYNKQESNRFQKIQQEEEYYRLWREKILIKAQQIQSQYSEISVEEIQRDIIHIASFSGNLIEDSLKRGQAMDDHNTWFDYHQAVKNGFTASTLTIVLTKGNLKPINIILKLDKAPYSRYKNIIHEIDRLYQGLKKKLQPKKLRNVKSAKVAAMESFHPRYIYLLEVMKDKEKVFNYIDLITHYAVPELDDFDIRTMQQTLKWPS
jgi:hypothetical protein